jgi:hypothetical protein
MERLPRRKTRAQIAAQTARERYRRQEKATKRAASLPWYQSLNKRPVSEYRTGWARPCSICGSQLLDQEKDGWCCNQGQWQLAPLEPYPAAFADFLDQSMQALQNQTRTLNNLFAFSAIGYTGEQLRYNGPQNVVITGRVYHRMLDLDADQSSLRWFLFDEQGHFRASA